MAKPTKIIEGVTFRPMRIGQWQWRTWESTDGHCVVRGQDTGKAVALVDGKFLRDGKVITQFDSVESAMAAAVKAAKAKTE